MEWQRAFVLVCWLFMVKGGQATYSDVGHQYGGRYDENSLAHRQRQPRIDDLCHIGDGMYPHPTDCSKFVHCSNLEAFIKDCGPGTVFNSIELTCDWPINVDCTDRSVKTADRYIATTPRQFQQPTPEHRRPTSEPYYRPTSEPYYRPTSEPYYRPTSEPYYRPTSEPYYRPTQATYHRPTSEPYRPTSEPYRQPSEPHHHRPAYQPPAENHRPYYGESIIQPRFGEDEEEELAPVVEDRFAVETIRPNSRDALANAFAINPQRRSDDVEAKILKTKTRFQHSQFNRLPLTTTTSKPHVDVEFVHPPISAPESATIQLPGPKLVDVSIPDLEEPIDDMNIEESMRILDTYMQEKRPKASQNNLIPIYNRQNIRVFNTEQDVNLHGAGKMPYNHQYYHQPGEQVTLPTNADALRVLPISEALKLLLNPYMKTKNNTDELAAQMKENLIQNQTAREAEEFSEYDSSIVQTLAIPATNEASGEETAVDQQIDTLNQARGEPYAQPRIQSEVDTYDTAKTNEPNAWNSLSDHEQRTKQQHTKTKGKFGGYSYDSLPGKSTRVGGRREEEYTELNGNQQPIYSFDCGTGQYIHPQQICDGKGDCDNGKDELDCTVLGFEEANTEKLVDECRFGLNCGDDTCVPLHQVCDGKHDCLNRLDEQDCGHIGYEVRLAAGDLERTNCGLVEVKVYEQWGYVCESSFDMAAASVLCRELGFSLGASEIRTSTMSLAGANVSLADAFMMDGLRCNGTESSLKDCDFKGWGIHNCSDTNLAGVVCKEPPKMACPLNYWLCDRSEECIHISFVCDGVSDCSDNSDEIDARCTAPINYRLANDNMYGMQGRAEIQYKGVWGTVCDDDFGMTEAQVFCRSLGYDGPANITKLPLIESTGPIWLDQVTCKGNEMNIADCMHLEYGTNNCNHTEDIAVRCSHGTELRMTAQLQQLPVNPTSRTGRADDDHSAQLIEIEANLPQSSETNYDDGTCGTIKVSFPNNANEQLSDKAMKGYHPWQASVRVRGSVGKSFHWCGAVLVGPHHFLTAAHCLNGYMKGAYIVRVGDHLTNVVEESERELDIDSWHIHEHFRKGQANNNDIALIRTKQPVTFGEYVQPICLPIDDAIYTPGRNCSISGWGSKSTPTKELRMVVVPLVSSRICRREDVYGNAITDGMVCAGSWQNEADACDGDSGGPLTCTERDGANYLYGLISWGHKCGSSKKPGVYVKVAHYLPWIREKMSATNISTGVKH